MLVRHDTYFESQLVPTFGGELARRLARMVSMWCHSCSVTVALARSIPSSSPTEFAALWMAMNVKSKNSISAGPMMPGVPSHNTKSSSTKRVTVAEEDVAMARKERTKWESFMLL